HDDGRKVSQSRLLSAQQSTALAPKRVTAWLLAVAVLASSPATSAARRPLGDKSAHSHSRPHHATRLKVSHRRIHWRTVRHAKYYQVVLWQGSGRVADIWTTRRSLTVRHLRDALAPSTIARGRYLWFVYP